MGFFFLQQGRIRALDLPWEQLGKPRENPTDPCPRAGKGRCTLRPALLGTPPPPFPVPWGIFIAFSQDLWQWRDSSSLKAVKSPVWVLLSWSIPSVQGWICPLAVQGHVLAPRLVWDRDFPGQICSRKSPSCSSEPSLYCWILFFPLPGENPESSALKTSGIFAALEQGWDFPPNPQHFPDFWALYL